MTDIRITAGSFGEGGATYEDGLFRFPNGDVRGVEDLEAFDLPGDPASEPHWSGDIVRGLQGALATSTKGLPSPFGFAASFVGIGLDALDSPAKTPSILSLTFSDRAAVTIATDGEVASVIHRDREVIRLALLRRTPAPLPEPVSPTPDPADPTLTSMFQYEKRKGRLRRVATEKAPEEG